MSIALSIGNNLTTGGVFTADAVNNTSVTNVTDFASVPGGGVLKLLSTQTASASASIEFNMDSTYDSYVFKLINIHPSANPGIISFQATTDGTNYNTTVTSSYFRAYHNESGSSSGLQYAVNFDQAQGTSIQNLDSGSGNDSDLASSGTLQIFNPSNTTYVKHFISNLSDTNDGQFNHNVFVAGYFNTTNAITGIRFQMDSGNIDDGIIKMYGVV